MNPVRQLIGRNWMFLEIASKVYSLVDWIYNQESYYSYFGG